MKSFQSPRLGRRGDPATWEPFFAGGGALGQAIPTIAKELHQAHVAKDLKLLADLVAELEAVLHHDTTWCWREHSCGLD